MTGGSISHHVADVRCARRVGEQRRFQIIRSELLADGKRKDIDHLVGVRADEMCAENALAAIFDQNLRAVDRLSRLPSGEPVGGFLAIDAELETLLARRSLG